jgi:hypothetical protein
MRTSFIYAITSIAVAAASSLFLPAIVVMSIALCAVALTALWLAHIAAYSLKALARSNSLPQSDPHTPSIPRREMFGTFAKIAAAATLSTAMPGVAFADRVKSKDHPKSKGRVQCCPGCYSDQYGNCSGCDATCL